MTYKVTFIRTTQDICLGFTRLTHEKDYKLTQCIVLRRSRPKLFGGQTKFGFAIA